MLNSQVPKFAQRAAKLREELKFLRPIPKEIYGVEPLPGENDDEFQFDMMENEYELI